MSRIVNISPSYADGESSAGMNVVRIVLFLLGEETLGDGFSLLDDLDCGFE